MCSNLPEIFFAGELQAALQDQSFGIQSFSIISTTPYQAIASVKLLEGEVIKVKLTNRGYNIEPASSSSTSSPENLTYESIENLLHSASHLYEGKRHEAWVGKLEKLLSMDKVGLCGCHRTSELF